LATEDRRGRTAEEIADDVMATMLLGRLWAEGFRTADLIAFDDAQWSARVREGSVPAKVRARVIDEMTFCQRDRARSVA
jgi:hypothetical protein